METTGIRLEVEPWLYEALCEEQEGRRQKTGRKQSLSTLILEFCAKGLTVSGHFVQKKLGFEQKNSDSVQNFTGFVQNNPDDGSPIHQINLDEIVRLKEILLRQQQDLQDKERRLATREREIKEKEQELTEKTQKALQEWNKLLDSKEQSQQKNLDKAPQKWQIERQSLELIDKNEAIKKMKQENIQLRDDIIKTLRKIDQQTEKNIIFDYIVPFLPCVISIIGFFMTNRKIDNIQELSPVQEEIGNIMKKLNDTDRKILSAKLDESLKTFAVKPVTDK